MNQFTNKNLKRLQEQHDEYLIDLDPKTTKATIGHTTASFPDESEFTGTSDELVSQKSFVPDEAKQTSKIKQNDNLLINKPIIDVKKTPNDTEQPDTNSNDNQDKEILNIGESNLHKDFYNKTPTSLLITKMLKDIKGAINNLYSINKLLTKLSVESHHEYSPKELKDILEHVTSIEDRMIDDLEEYFDDNIQQAANSKLDEEYKLYEEFKSKAQARYFYSQAKKPGKTGKKWKKMADEFSSKTDFKELPDHVNESTSKEININKLLELLLK